MTVFEYFLIFFGVYTFQYLMYLFNLNSDFRRKLRTDVRKCAILIAARNEKNNILECLQSLANLNYPKDKFDVFIGDDQSIDKTAEIIQKFAQNHPNFHYRLITKQFPDIRAKQNVLANLFKETDAEYIFVTDADIQVQKNWLQSMMGGFTNEHIDMVCAPTCVQGNSTFSNIQQLDWLNGSSVLYAHSVLRMPITAIGNNFGITKSSYEALGGYEYIPHSVTEDYQLFKSFRAKGFHHKFIFHKDVLNFSKPMQSFKQIFNQRMRWLKGGKKMSWYNFSLFTLSFLAFPALITSFFLLPIQQSSFLILLKFLADFFFVANSLNLLKLRKKVIYFPIYWIFYQIFSIVVVFASFLPIKIQWKNRTI